MNKRTSRFLLRSKAKGRRNRGTQIRWQSERLEDRMLLAVGPQLVGINPSNGGLLLSGTRLDVAPHELTFRFDENQIIDARTLDGIQIVRAGGDGSLTDNSNVLIQPGFKGIGESPNEVVVRFAETLPDDLYRITIVGSGATALTNVAGDPFNGGQTAKLDFELTLGAQIVSVVPQPVSRIAGSKLSQNKAQIEVYFNNDDLLDGPTSAENPAFYQLIATHGTVSNLDDEVFRPVSVDYSETLDRAVLTFRDEIAALAGNGVYRLRIGTDEVIPLAPVDRSPTSDPGSSFATSTNLGQLDTRSVVINQKIEAQKWSVEFPGSVNEPGHRDIPAQSHYTSDNPGDTVDGVTTMAYNFQVNYGVDSFGNSLFNVITNEQKQRAREVLQLYSDQLGVQFYETPDQGITLVSGDMRVVKSVPIGRGAVLGTSGLVRNKANEFQPMIVLDNAEQWDNSIGGDFYQVMMREVGRVLGIGVTEELPAPVVTGNNVALLYGQAPDPLVYPEISEGIYPAGAFRDPVLPDPATVIHGQYLFRPDSVDLDSYRFVLGQAGQFTAETLAERAANSSLLNTVITLYREQGSTRELIAQNDDFYSKDSLLDLTLEAGTYYVIVSASGNDKFDPAIENTGSGGKTQGDYQLLLKYRPVVGNNSVIRDKDATNASPSGTALDGDGDGKPGGVYNYWFQAVKDSTNLSAPRTLFVDKSFVDSANSTLQLGSLARPYNNLQVALSAARPGDIVRIVGNGGADANLSTLGDNLAYEVGRSSFGNLSDGRTFDVPKGVSIMIDAGAVFKVSQASINVGSVSVNVDRSGSSIQVLGTPTNPVVFTSANDESIGVDTNPLVTTPAPGNWGGIFISHATDRSEGRSDFEQAGIFLDYINHADIRYGGGRVRLDSVTQVVDPIHIVDARPTISFNKITKSADAAISANPDSFEVSDYLAPDSLGINYQGTSAATRFTPDYSRIGPEIHGNSVTQNSINGLFVRIDTPAGQTLEKMTVTGRWNDTDIVHVLSENLVLQGTPGGPTLNATTGNRIARTDAHLIVDPGVVVKLDGTRIEAEIGANVTIEGTAAERTILTSMQDVRYGAGGTFDTSSGDAVAAAGDWSGIYAFPGSQLSIDNAVLAYGGGISRLAGSFASFNTIEIHQARARIANSTIQFSAKGTGGQAAVTRAGRGRNEVGAIYVRGSQPVIINNIIQGTKGDNSPAITIDVNSLSHDLVSDLGRTRGFTDRMADTQGNYGPLVRNNRIGDNGINGMVVRGGTLQTESVWDDTSIVHVLQDEVIIPDFHTFGGLRIQSSATASLVVKLSGEHAGFHATGWPLDINDRIGGRVDILGQPGSPVVLTSLADDSVGAGLDLKGRPQLDTDGGGRPEPQELPGTFQININYGPIARSTPEFVRAVEAAVQEWERLLEDPITITIDMEIADLPDGVLGVTSAQETALPYDTIRQAMINDASGRDNESIVASLPLLANLTSQSVLPFDPTQPFSLAPTVQLTRANALAIGISPGVLPSTPSLYDPTDTLDARIEINTNPFGFQPDFEPIFFDRNRDDGILPDQYDLTGVVIHEIGHALGFISSVDEVNAALLNPALPRAISPSPLDLFRLAPGTGQVNFTTAPRVFDPKQFQVFYDGGFYDPDPLAIAGLGQGDIPLSTSSSLNTTHYGDGNQASHWADLPGLGVMMPALSPGVEQNVLETDRQAFDLIGYNVVGGPVAGDWRGIVLDQNSHDRNVPVIIEEEPVSGETDSNTNNSTASAELLGSLAKSETTGDDTLRLGFEVHGELGTASDTDYFSFVASAGTEVWFDIDKTSSSLDSVVELVDANGNVYARSDNSNTETSTGGNSTRFAASGVFVSGLNKSLFSSTDYYSTNPLDAGMRVILPGAAGTSSTYIVRVRSSSSNLTNLTGGLTSGVYQLGIRLRETDEVPGSSIEYSHIGYSVDGIRVQGLPAHSPLSGEVVEDSSPNSVLANQDSNFRSCLRVGLTPNVGGVDPSIDPPNGIACEPSVTNGFSDAQYVGNLLSTDRAAISIRGELKTSEAVGGAAGPGDVDWYLFEVGYGQTAANGGLTPPQNVDVVFDIDYADGLARANISLAVYEATTTLNGIFVNHEDIGTGALVYTSQDSSNRDDLPQPFTGAGLNDLSRGSVGKLDPFLGPVNLTPGFYLLKVTAAVNEPVEFRQYKDPLPANPFIRMEPVNAMLRIAEDHVNLPLDEAGIGTVDPPVLPQLIDPVVGPTPKMLGDLVMFMSKPSATGGTEILTVDPFTGTIETTIGGFSRPTGDIALRDNPNYDRSVVDEDGNLDPELSRVQRLHAFNQTLDGAATDENTGNYLYISTEDGSLTNAADDGALPDDNILTYLADPAAEDPAEAGPVRAQEVEDGQGGINFEALTFDKTLSDDYPTGYAVGNRADGVQDNIMYKFNSVTGNAISKAGLRENEALIPIPGTNAGTQIVEQGILNTRDGGKANTVLLAPSGSAITDGMTLTVASSIVGQPTAKMEFNTQTYTVVTNPSIGVHVRDGDKFVAAGQTYVFDTGPVLSVSGVMVDGDRFTLTDSRGVSKTFEFDSGNGVASGNIAVTIGSAQASLIASAINKQGDFTIIASLAGNRISLESDSTTVVPVSLTSKLIVDGAYGAVGNAIRVEESWTTEKFVNAIVKNLNGVAGNSGSTLGFLGASDLSELQARNIVIATSGNSSVTAGSNPVNFFPWDSAATIAQRLTGAIIAAETPVSGIYKPVQSGDIITFQNGTVTATGTATQAAFKIGGKAPGGRITGIAFVGDSLFGVSDLGGLFAINPDTGTATYIATSVALIGSRFTGLSAVPEGHGLEGALIASTARGLVAFDTAGKLLPILQGGTSTVSFKTAAGAPFSGANGVAFGIQGENLWHVTTRRGGDAGQDTVGSESFYFGDQGDANTSRNYNFAGGTQGSLITNEFSLQGFSADDAPTLYFSYFLSTEDRNGADSFRVFITDDAAAEGRGEWHLLASNQSENVVDPRVPSIQSLFDNSFQDSGDGVQNPFPYSDTSQPFDPGSLTWSPFETTVLNEENLVWRQARVPLGTFAGSDSLRLRFDFSTAASFDMGATGGVELHAVSAKNIADGDTVVIDNVTFEFNLGVSLATSSAPAFADGDLIIVDSGTGVPSTLEIDKNGTLTDPSHISVALLDSDTSIQTAQKLAAAITQLNLTGVTVGRLDNRISVAGVKQVRTTSLVGLQISGSNEVADGHVAIPINADMTSEEVAAAIKTVITDRLAHGSPSVFPVNYNIIHLVGHTVSNAGPLGFANKLPGDLAASFYNRLRGANNNAEIVGNPEDAEQSFRLNYEGAYVDDLIIGFASFGESSRDDRPDYCDVVVGGCGSPLNNPVIPDVFADQTGSGVRTTVSGATTGPYQLEIRRGTDISDGFGIDRTIDPRDRLAQALTIIAPAGGDLFDGRLFHISDGTHTVQFEFNDFAQNNGVSVNSVAIPFSPAYPAFTMAELIRDAINQANRQGLLDLSAATADGLSSGTGTTVNRVNVFGNAVMTPEPAPNGIEFLVQSDIGSGNQFRDQGQLILYGNNIYESARFGIVVEAAKRDMPGEPTNGEWKPPIPFSQYTTSDYNPHAGGARALEEPNTGNLLPGVTIVNNVVAVGGEGAIHFAGDAGGYIMVAPVAGDEPNSGLARAEVWDSLPFSFRVTDHNGLIEKFEFNLAGSTVFDPLAIPVTWAPVPEERCYESNNCSPRYSPADRDTADALMEAIESSKLDITVYRSASDELYIEGATLIEGMMGNVLDPWFTSFISRAQPGGVPYGRIVNNTLIGNGGTLDLKGSNVYQPDDFNDAGILLEYNASPTVLNNAIVNFERGVSADRTVQSTVFGGQIFQGNITNARNVNTGDFAVLAPNTASLFVDIANGNYYPAEQSLLIDSSVDSLEDRPALVDVKSAVGIGLSPVLSPDSDLLGQRRVDDPSVEPPFGFGRDVFKDRGAIDRSDVAGPTVEFLVPKDNGSEDFNSALTQIRLNTTLLPRFEIRLNDGSEPGLSTGGSGIDASTVTTSAVKLFQDGVQLTDTIDYLFSYDATNRTIRLTPTAGVWESGRTYVIQFVNSSSGIRDVAGENLAPNQSDGSTKFTVEFVAPTDLGDAPDGPYPTLIAHDGARHNIVASVFLGAGITSEDDGLPSSTATGDVDDGVTFSSFQPGTSTNFTVTASVNGFIDAWIDFNQDGDWVDAGEQIFASKAVVPGANVLEATIPSSALVGTSFARFRYSTKGGLASTGAASDGEVEDYVVRIGPDASWQNPINRLDVNNDTFVTAIDALLVINELNRPKVSDPTTGKLPSISVPPSVPPGFLDVNGDGYVAPIDALLVINFLNLQSAQQQAVVTAAAPVVVAASIPASTPLSTSGHTEVTPRVNPVDAVFATAIASRPNAYADTVLPASRGEVGATDMGDPTDEDSGFVSGSSDWSASDELFNDIAAHWSAKRVKKA